MKKIINGEELYKNMEYAVNLLCNTVKVTLGPKGNNVIIDHSNFSPYITNDGVTIAENIESDDEIVNTILTLAKEASIKTNEMVGDGTTTTLVLLQGIFNEGLKLIRGGVNPIILKKELNESLDKIIDNIKKLSKKPNKKDLLAIANISANDNIIGKNIFDAFTKTKSINAINLVEFDEANDKLEFLKGYRFETLLASNILLENKETTLNNSKIIIVDNILNDINEISVIINNILDNKDNLIIIANDYSDLFIENIININMEENIKVILLKSPEYAIKQKEILIDICVITNSRIITNTISLNDLGYIKNININNDTTTIYFDSNLNIVKRIEELKKDKNNEQSFIDKRIAMFNNTLSNIYIGANTTLERREKKMRYIDSLHAISTSLNGILPGEGLSLLKIQNDLKVLNNGDKTFKSTLDLPFKNIMINSGLDENNIIEQIKKYNYKTTYNTYTNNYENVDNTNILDPTNVVINSIKNATSIASMLLTTSNLIINEYKSSLNKLNNYNEL